MAAPTADINAILAALAAHNQGSGVPQQQQSTPLPPGFPVGIPQQSSTPLGGFALPRPTNSGSVDLSSIRPVNSGSVSIADAIAKAKSIAADRNPSSASSRDDPRLAGRSYRPSRSRSRSPPRRENYRDNYNPYRDDRRGGGSGNDDRRGGNNNRRSASPPRNQPSYGGGQDKEVETMTVKSALVGLIIGRAGENLRRIEATSGGRVQFIPAATPGAPQRQCTITGTRAQRESAKTEIIKTVDDNGGDGSSTFEPLRMGSTSSNSRPPQSSSMGRGSSSTPSAAAAAGPVVGPGETSRQILVPDKTVGLIIGRGGETIRDLQDRSGCHVNIVGENKSVDGRRPVNLIGTQEAADAAEALIWEIVESDTRNSQAANANTGRGMQQSAPPQQHSYGQQQNRFEDDKITENIRIPSEAVGMVIGKGGEAIKEMQATTSCRINVNQPNQPDIERQIDLIGSRTAIEAAKRAIWDKVDAVVSFVL